MTGKIKCTNPNCQDGKVWIDSSHRQGKRWRHQETCLVCHGTGEVPESAPPDGLLLTDIAEKLFNFDGYHDVMRSDRKGYYLDHAYQILEVCAPLIRADERKRIGEVIDLAYHGTIRPYDIHLKITKIIDRLKAGEELKP